MKTPRRQRTEGRKQTTRGGNLSALALPSVLSLVAMLVFGLTSPARTQSLTERVADAPDGRTRFSYAARPGVCGNGTNISYETRENEDWESACDSGPVRVVITKKMGDMVRLRVYLGGQWRPPTSEVTDLGVISARAASTFLFDVAQDAESQVARSAIRAATLADSARAGSRLIDLARSAGSERVRHAALEAAAMEASRMLSEEGLVSEANDEHAASRERAVFALSQMPKDEGIPRLIRIARDSEFSHVRKRALFWLGQSGDERAIGVIEEALTRR